MTTGQRRYRPRLFGRLGPQGPYAGPAIILPRGHGPQGYEWIAFGPIATFPPAKSPPRDEPGFRSSALRRHGLGAAPPRTHGRKRGMPSPRAVRSKRQHVGTVLEARDPCGRIASPPKKRCSTRRHGQGTKAPVQSSMANDPGLGCHRARYTKCPNEGNDDQLNQPRPQKVRKKE